MCTEHPCVHLVVNHHKFREIRNKGPPPHLPLQDQRSAQGGRLLPRILRYYAVCEVRSCMFACVKWKTTGTYACTLASLYEYTVLRWICLISTLVHQYIGEKSWCAKLYAL